MEWIKALPEELMLNNAWLCVWNAWSLTQTGLLKDAGTWIDAAERAQKKLISDPDFAIANPQEINNLKLEITTLQGINCWTCPRL